VIVTNEDSTTTSSKEESISFKPNKENKPSNAESVQKIPSSNVAQQELTRTFVAAPSSIQNNQNNNGITCFNRHQQQITSNYVGLSENEVAILMRYCRNTLFTRVKFINNDFLHQNERIVQKCFQCINKNPSDMRCYNPITKIMKHGTNSKRAYVTDEICKILEGK
jgi:hypothetical protein